MCSGFGRYHEKCPCKTKTFDYFPVNLYFHTITVWYRSENVLSGV